MGTFIEACMFYNAFIDVLNHLLLVLHNTQYYNQIKYSYYCCCNVVSVMSVEKGFTVVQVS